MAALDMDQLKKESVPVSNVDFIRPEDKLEAKHLLRDYDKYSKNVPQKAKCEWLEITPAPQPWKQIPNHIHPSPREIKAEELYNQGKLKEAKKIMNKVHAKY